LVTDVAPAPGATGTGSATTRELSYRDALREAITQEMDRDERVVLLGEDIGAYGGSYVVTRGFQEKYGRERVIDTPIAESGIVGASIGAAMGGMRPIVELMTINFSLLAIDQIVNHAAKMRHMFGGQFGVPMVIRTAAGWGALAATHSQTFEGWYAHIPGLIVVMPSTPADAKGLLTAAIRSEDPIIFIEHSLIYRNKGPVPEGDFELPLFGSQVRRPGKDVTIVSWSRMAHVAEGVANELRDQEGADAEIVDLRVLRPLDMKPVIESVKKTNRVVVAEESWRTMGLGAEIAARIQEEAFDYLDAPVARVASLEVPVPYAKNLERIAFPGKDELMAAVKHVLYRK
jgi:pyruvate dehydrogenase E1 component subunit beta